MHYYQFNIGDYAGHTAHLTDIEDLAYRRMLDYCYLNECGLPETVEQIARVIRMRTHCDGIANVLLEFFVRHEDGTYRQARIEREIDAYKGKSRKASESARKRWENADANALPTHSERNAKHKPLTINHKPLTIRDIALPDGIADRKDRGTRLPPEWTLPESWRNWAMEQGMTGTQALETSNRFRDYWISTAGKKAIKTDWLATWRNWVRNERNSAGYTAGGFVERHTDTSWREGFIEKYDGKWADGL